MKVRPKGSLYTGAVPRLGRIAFFEGETLQLGVSFGTPWSDSIADAYLDITLSPQTAWKLSRTMGAIGRTNLPRAPAPPLGGPIRLRPMPPLLPHPRLLREAPMTDHDLSRLRNATRDVAQDLVRFDRDFQRFQKEAKAAADAGVPTGNITAALNGAVKGHPSLQKRLAEFVAQLEARAA